jgi:tetratricopeptide (TPR) repeat protein
MALLEAILVDAHGPDEQLWAFRQAFENVELPAEALVIGERVSLVGVEYNGNERRGLEARCLRSDGSRHVVSLADVFFPDRSGPARHVAAYRIWLGVLPLLPWPSRAGEPPPPRSPSTRPPADDADDVRSALATHQLEPLRLEPQGLWDPAAEYWREEGAPIASWAKPIVARGPRPMYEMEQVLPGADFAESDWDPIIEANDLKERGDVDGARAILNRLLQKDVRCLDAHAHLGNLVFPKNPREALAHYERGVRIGEIPLGPAFDGVLAWGLIDNRPFLRCMQGLGLCLWRLRRFTEAERVFDRMLWLNPSDNQGIRFLLPDVRARRPWRPRR